MFGAVCVVAAVVGSVTGCSTPEPLTLSGPNASITVEIPQGWHQVIDSSDSSVPEIVSPVSCMGRGEAQCALGLARIASYPAVSAQAAEEALEKVVLSGPGVTRGVSISQGPGKVGGVDGYRHRFEFTNPGAALTTELAAVPSGPSTLDANGNRLFSAVLVWVVKKPGAPELDVIDDIINSVKVLPAAPVS